MRKVVSVILVIMLLLTISPVTYGLSYTASLSADNASVKPGETVSIILSISNIDMDLGVMNLTGILTFDENIFEPISASATSGAIQQNSPSKMLALNGWSGLTYNTTSKKFVMESGDYMVEANSIAQITLKVKEGVEPTETTVSVTDIEASNGDADVKTDNASVKITVAEATPGDNGEGEGDGNGNNGEDNSNPGDDNNNGNNVNNNTNNGNNNNSNNNASNTSKNDKTVIKQSNLPKTGIASGIIATGAVLVVIAVVSYKKYSSMKNVK